MHMKGQGNLLGYLAKLISIIYAYISLEVIQSSHLLCANVCKTSTVGQMCLTVMFRCVNLVSNVLTLLAIRLLEIVVNALSMNRMEKGMALM